MTNQEKIILEDLKDIYGCDIPWEKLRDTEVLITGAYGMLASYMMYMLIFLNETQNMNIKIIALVRSKEKFYKRFKKHAKREYIRLFLDPLDEKIDISQRIDYIIHAASFASPQYYSVCPVDVLKPNSIGTYHLLELAREKKVNAFLLFSTGDIYGVVKDGNAVSEGSMGTLDPLDVHSCYSESKRMAETTCKSYQHQFDVPVKIARIWHTYGPTMDIENDPRVFSSFVKNVVKRENIIMKSEGKQKRSFCYIADATAGFFYILLSGIAGEAYNICNTEQFVSIRTLAETIADLRPEYHIDVVRKNRDADEDYTENTSVGELAPDNRKLIDLGWEPRYRIREGFDRVLRFFGC